MTPPDPDAYDRMRRRVLWSLPNGLYLLGSRQGGSRNMMTISWVTQVATSPAKLVGVGVESGSLTHRLVADGGAFALSLVRRADRAVIRKFVKPAADDPAAGTLAGEPVRTAVTGAPVLAAALAWLDCEVRHDLDVGSHTFFVGEVVACGEDDAAGHEVLRMEDTRMSYGG